MTKPDRKLLTPAAYARHRGCSRPAVAKALRENRITLTPEGLIDPVAADAQWQARTRPRMTMKAKAPATAAAEATADISYAEARRRQAVADMHISERECARQARQLVRVAEVKRVWGDMLTTVKTRLLNIPHRIAPQFPQEHYHQVHKLLKDEIHDALTELSRSDGVPAAGDDDA